MSKKGETAFMGIGILAGLTLSGPAAQTVTSITATLSSQPIYVDGQRVTMTAYSIGGNNYVRLRNIGRAVDFGVTYDAAANSVYIDSTQPYYEEITATLSTPTEESVQATLAQLREIYPTGAVFPTPYRSTSVGPYNCGIHCSGWATLCSDAAFGDLPWWRINRPNWGQLRPGYLVEYQNDQSYHVVIMVDKMDEYIKVTESGTNNHLRWGRAVLPLVVGGTVPLYQLYPVPAMTSTTVSHWGPLPTERPPNRFRFVRPCRAVCAYSTKRAAYPSVPLAQMKRGVGPFVRRCCSVQIAPLYTKKKAAGTGHPKLQKVVSGLITLSKLSSFPF